MAPPLRSTAGVEGGAGAEELAEVWSGQKRWEALFERFFCTPPRPEEIRAQVLKDREQQVGWSSGHCCIPSRSLICTRLCVTLL